MKIEEIIKNKSNIEKEINNILEFIYQKEECKPEELLIKLNNLIEILKLILEYSPDKIQQLLGYEFNINLDRNIISENNELPLYIIIELIIKTISLKYMEKFPLKDKILSSLGSLTLINRSISKLNYKRTFNPNEEISEDIIKSIIDANGIFKIKLDTQFNIEYPLLITYEKEDSHYNEKSIPLYQKDQDNIKKIFKEKTKINLKKLERIKGKYFKDSGIPFSFLFESSIEKDIDPRIREMLYKITLIKDETLGNDYVLAYRVELLIKELEKIEQIIESEQQLKQKEAEEKKQQTISKVKEKYKEKNLLWKFFNKKINPENIDLDNMSIEEIEELYRKVK